MAVRRVSRARPTVNQMTIVDRELTLIRVVLHKVREWHDDRPGAPSRAPSHQGGIPENFPPIKQMTLHPLQRLWNPMQTVTYGGHWVDTLSNRYATDDHRTSADQRWNTHGLRVGLQRAKSLPGVSEAEASCLHPGRRFCLRWDFRHAFRLCARPRHAC